MLHYVLGIDKLFKEEVLRIIMTEPIDPTLFVNVEAELATLSAEPAQGGVILLRRHEVIRLPLLLLVFSKFRVFQNGRVPLYVYVSLCKFNVMFELYYSSTAQGHDVHDVIILIADSIMEQYQ